MQNIKKEMHFPHSLLPLLFPPLFLLFLLPLSLPFIFPHLPFSPNIKIFTDYLRILYNAPWVHSLPISPMSIQPSLCHSINKRSNLYCLYTHWTWSNSQWLALQRNLSPSLLTTRNNIHAFFLNAWISFNFNSISLFIIWGFYHEPWSQHPLPHLPRNSLPSTLVYFSIRITVYFKNFL